MLAVHKKQDMKLSRTGIIIAITLALSSKASASSKAAKNRPKLMKASKITKASKRAYSSRSYISWGSYSMSIPPQDTTHVITIDIGQVSRTFTVFDPASLPNTNKKRPVIIAFHGLGGDSEAMRRSTQFDRVAKQRGWLVVYPLGEIDKGLTYWNGQGCCKEDGADDISFAKTIIDYTVTNFQVDEDNVFISGFSNGAFMGYKLLCELGNRDNGKPWITAIAVHSGLIGAWGSDFNSCSIPNKIPLLHFHGELDPGYFVPIAGKCKGRFCLPFPNAEWKSLEDSIVFVAQKMCGSSDITSSSNPSGTTTCNQLCYGGVEYCLVEDLGHHWSGSSTPDADGNHPQMYDPAHAKNVDATEYFAAFFDRVSTK